MPNQHRYQLIGFRPTDELRDKLERIASDRGETLSDVLRRACWDLVNHYPGMEPDVDSDGDA